MTNLETLGIYARGECRDYHCKQCNNKALHNIYTYIRLVLSLQSQKIRKVMERFEILL